MKITYAASQAELGNLAALLKRTYRGRVQLRFTEDGVEAVVELGEAARLHRPPRDPEPSAPAA